MDPTEVQHNFVARQLENRMQKMRKPGHSIRSCCSNNSVFRNHNGHRLPRPRRGRNTAGEPGRVGPSWRHHVYRALTSKQWRVRIVSEWQYPPILWPDRSTHGRDACRRTADVIATAFLMESGGDWPVGRRRQETARFPRASSGNRADLRRLPSHTFCVGTRDLASISPTVRSVSNNVRRTPPSVSANLRRKPPLIARPPHFDCAPLHLLTAKPMNRIDAWRMIQRRSADLGMRVKIGCHTFRATGITAYLEAGGTLETPRPWRRTKARAPPNSTIAPATRSRSTRSNKSRSNE